VRSEAIPAEAPAGSGPKLLDRVRKAARPRRYSIRTEEAKKLFHYPSWLRTAAVA